MVYYYKNLIKPVAVNQRYLIEWIDHLFDRRLNNEESLFTSMADNMKHWNIFCKI
jgi:hypothetical protein